MHVNQKALNPEVLIDGQTVHPFAIVVPVRSDLQFARVPALAGTFGSEGLQMGAVLVEILADDVPAIAIADHSPDGRRAYPANDQRDTTGLHGPGPHHKPLPAHELALVIDFLATPDGFERLQIVIGTLAPVRKGHPNRLEFLP